MESQWILDGFSDCSFSVFLFTFSIHSQTEWESTITAKSIVESSLPQILTFAMKQQATTGFDQQIDQIAPSSPVSPINLDVFFPLDNLLVSRLVTDTQPISLTHSWLFQLRADNDGGTLTWNVSQLPRLANIKLRSLSLDKSMVSNFLLSTLKD